MKRSAESITMPAPKQRSRSCLVIVYREQVILYHNTPPSYLPSQNENITIFYSCDLGRQNRLLVAIDVLYTLFDTIDRFIFTAKIGYWMYRIVIQLELDNPRFLTTDCLLFNVNMLQCVRVHACTGYQFYQHNILLSQCLICNFNRTSHPNHCLESIRQNHLQ